MPTVAFYTLGCKLNQYETEAMRQQLEKLGYKSVDFNEPADVYVINTCTVTHRSDQRCRQMIRRAARWGRGYVVVTGCYAQRDASSIMQIPGVNLVLGNVEKGRIGEYLRGNLGKSIFVSPIARQRDFQEVEVADFAHHTRAFLKIQDGCDGECTYCVVPTARGRSRSRSFQAVLDQVERFLQSGYREIVLTGVNLGRYRDPHDPQKDLAFLLRWLQEQPHLGRVRLSSIEPTDFTHDLIEVLGQSEKICRHVHIPMQSGDDDILRAMGRPYGADQFSHLIEELYKAVPGIAIGVDVIVGFPGEGDRQFTATQSLLEKLPICRFHVFSFSQRSGTPATIMSSQVPTEICRERSQILRTLSNRKFQAFRASFLYRQLTVLAERRRDGDTGMLTGLSDNYIRVLFNGPDKYMNRLLSMNIDRVDHHRAWGHLASGVKI